MTDKKKFEVCKRNESQLLIVGGSGFIGSHILKKALIEGFKTTVISKNNQSSIGLVSDVCYICVDISDRQKLKVALKDKEFNYVINLGGYINHNSYFESGEVFNVHFNGVKNLVDILEKKNLKSFIQIGSSDEYGNNSAPQFESQREMPISSYSCAKLLSTNFLQTLYKTDKFPSVVLRLFLVYGPGQSEDRFIPQIIKGCMSGINFPVSQGNQKRDFCFVDDVVSGIFASLDNKEALGEVINVASGSPIEIKDVIKKITSIIGSGSPKYGQIKFRASENINLFADISKAKKILKWKPKTSLDDGLSQTIFLK